MCWSGEASAAIAIAGFSSAYFLRKKGQPIGVWLPTAYFVAMEALQAVTYIYVDECGTAPNALLTYLAILHIAFQPFFINMLGMEFIDKDIKHKVQNWVYAACAVATAACILRLVPAYDLFGECEVGKAICAHTETCAYSGEWHIGWHVFLNGFNENWLWYIAAAFILPMLYGSWKWSVYHYVVGPFMASLTTADVSERPAVWCLFSTMIIALLVNTPLRKLIKVKSFPTWTLLRRKADNDPLPPS